jgi:hypothetical protein
MNHVICIKTDTFPYLKINGTGGHHEKQNKLICGNSKQKSKTKDDLKVEEGLLGNGKGLVGKRWKERRTKEDGREGRYDQNTIYTIWQS